MTAAVIYAAKSTDDKHGSIPTQLDDCRAMAEREGWEVAPGDVFQDEAKSAHHGNRGPGLAAAKERAARLGTKENPSMLVVQHSDRLARGDGTEADHLVELHFWGKRNHVRLRSVQDDSMLANVVTVAVAGEQNSAYSIRLSASMKSGLRRRAELGHHQGTAPYGYRMQIDRNDERDRGTLIVHETETEVVRRMFAAYLAGHGDDHIAHDLNLDGVRPQRGEKWHASSVRKMLRAPVYKGCVKFNGEALPGNHEAVIPEDVWDEAQRLRTSKGGKQRGRTPAGSHLLTGGLLRHSCGAAMRPRTRNGRTDLKWGEVYTCTRYGCDHSPKTVPAKEIDNTFLDWFLDCGLDVEATRERARASHDGQLREALALAAEAERDEQRVEAELARIKDDYKRGEITAADWRELKTELSEEVEACRNRNVQLQARAEQVTAAAERLDAEEDTLQRLADLEAAVLGRISGARDVPALRAALAGIFERIELELDDEGGWGLLPHTRLDDPQPVALELASDNTHTQCPV